MKRWVEQTYLYHFHKIPLEDIAVDWTAHMGEWSCVIELQIFRKYKDKQLPTLQEFINKL